MKPRYLICVYYHTLGAPQRQGWHVLFLLAKPSNLSYTVAWAKLLSTCSNVASEAIICGENGKAHDLVNCYSLSPILAKSASQELEYCLGSLWKSECSRNW